MKSFFSPLSFAAATVLLAAQLVSADPVAIPAPSTTVQLKSMTSKGCFSSSTGLTFNDTWTYQTSGYCQPLCVEMNKAVLATTGGSDCWCGDLLPPAASLVDDSFCNDPCDGYDTEMCGGDGYWTVYLSGTKTNVANAVASSSSSSASGGSSTTSAAPSVVTVGGQTIVVTASSQASSVSASAAAANKSGTSKAGIAAGVVVGVVASLSIAGGAFIFLRARKRREIEEGHRRNAAVNSFIGGGKPSTSSGSASFTDTRLDPAVMAQRRMSDGSIADNQDYSRRILKVTNA
ncbi:hypothetical protein BP6252_02499 [Coleophoma cylindrospora]|uniref:WSC domain-containing protein n=1 Tax=Coleophoma cylindrospora TaxID=1849047 RepID=A0A3D8SF00_9HELO|nr:hypothetical protein BP6252_02499 [Coleophoma cylindrospora]